jgi:hypothetical protein
MRGFCIGDKVRSTGGHDQAAPWAEMGQGSVVGPGKKKGYLVVHFAKTGESFTIKSSNLRNLTRCVEPLPGLKKSSSHGSFEQDRLKTSAGTCESGDATMFNTSGGLEIGDVVLDRRHGGVCKVVGIGSPGTVEVMYEALGTTAKVKASSLSKYANLSHLSKHPRRKTKIADTKLAPHLQPEKTRDIKWDAPVVPLDDDDENRLFVGDYVRVTKGTFADFGVGLIRALSRESGMAKVQLQSGGDCWVLRLDDLEIESLHGKFRPPGKSTDKVKQQERLARRQKKLEEEKERKELKEALAATRNSDPLAHLKGMLVEFEAAEDYHQLNHF